MNMGHGAGNVAFSFIIPCTDRCSPCPLLRRCQVTLAEPERTTTNSQHNPRPNRSVRTTPTAGHTVVPLETMSWHPSRIETRIKPTSRAPRCDYGSPTPLPEAIYRLGQVETQRRKDPVDFIEKTRFRARSGVGERAPSPELWRRQDRPERHRSGEFTFVDEVHRRHWGAEVEVSDTDSDDRKTEVQYDLASDQPVFYAFGELSRKGKRNSHPGGDGLSDNESAAVSGDEQETPRSVQQGSSVPGGKKHGAAAVYHVLESHYTGDGYAHGHHSAELKAILSERAVVPQSMFRWM